MQCLAAMLAAVALLSVTCGPSAPAAAPTARKSHGELTFGFSNAAEWTLAP